MSRGYVEMSRSFSIGLDFAVSRSRLLVTTSAILVVLVWSDRICVPVILLEPELKGEHVRVDSGIASRVSTEGKYVGVGSGSIVKIDGSVL